jgi:predicted nucleotidyltransferase component of viral defense system
MNWESSRALTPLKKDLIDLFFRREQSFYLTGGAALGIFYLQHRLSYDLDFFTPEQVNWHLVQNLVLDISRRIGANCRTVTAAPGFHRLELTRGDEREILDFVVEQVPQIDSQKERFGDVRVDTLREIAVNKVCTLLSRSEQKDIIDLFFLSKRGFDVLKLLPEAQKKDGGVEPGMLSYLLANRRIGQVPEYVLSELNLVELNAFIAGLQKDLAALAFPK